MQACYLGSIGGKDVPETTRRIMRSVFTNSLATRMNYLGRGGKTAIKNTSLLRCIIGEFYVNFLLHCSLFS